VNKANVKGSTPLYIAAYNGHEKVVRALIEAYADVNQAKEFGVTPLFIAAFVGNEAVVRALIEAGADVNKANAIGGTPLSVSTTTIHNIARGNHAAIVQILRDAGAV
jgi:ankyrin repeat protein